MIEKIMRRRAHHRGADQHRLGRGLEGVARAVVLLQEVLGVLEVGVEAEVPLDLLLDVGQRLDRSTARRRDWALSVTGP